MDHLEIKNTNHKHTSLWAPRWTRAAQDNIEPNFGPITRSMARKLQTTIAMALIERSIRLEFLEAQEMEVKSH